MDYLILTENEFFRLIHNRQDCSGVDAAYNEFVKCVVELCSGCHDLHHSLFAMTYAEIELQYHEMQNAAAASESGLNVYVRKALAFIRKMLKLLTIQVPPLTSTSFNSPKNSVPASVTSAFRWTGNAVDLVEIIYGIDEMGCINNGDTPIGELAAFFYALFGVDSKECYRFYTDIKRRKNDSRTYFLDKMQERLNKRMQQDDEKERMRR
ncbi:MULTISPECIES: RteC domain-containing protein [Bacteroides]|jgi:hypothetical protein|uniref:RteC domain-containing protein n=1 Tax=Bacteroides TaxID=816 RepID=UPI000E7D4266|nr:MULTISPECIES: RteC domain-containing protein [Bacteroides]MCS2520396.1 RteC domain-containing protein [Bacteroides thetaiotaomicron]RGN44435.1 RteC protein [Bacteroides sp. OM05-12]RHR72089.1 RteC protein [Bacteroides sp. AF16-49]